jgi:adenylyltransferase/sulfurtransferase
MFPPHLISRYSRQLILDDIGTDGQLGLLHGSVLVVGAGGLGSPAILYLAAAGVGRIGIVDHDTVEISNLQRQIIHTEHSEGVSKADSARDSAHKLNSTCAYMTYPVLLDAQNAKEIISEYNVVLDCTDNVATRYLLNDACLLLGKPLVSGSALRMDGQLTVYGYKEGPCYRCLFPVPPPPETVTNCSDGGIVGAVTGIIGSLQALEAMKILTGKSPAYTQKLLLFEGHTGVFRTIRLRGKNATCDLCGERPMIKDLLPNYPLFCGAGPHDKTVSLDLLDEKDKISCKELSSNLDQSSHSIILLDVRESVQYRICSLPGSLSNISRCFSL